MIYLDNAATTYPKPPEVRRAMAEALVMYGANPGRSGHRLAMRTAEAIYDCRIALADMFGLPEPSGVIFTPNCTVALNTVIKGLLSEGGHAVISDMEHNSVIRPLTALAKRGVTFTEVKTDCVNKADTLRRFAAAIRPDTKLVLCTHASNVLGWRLPIREIGFMAQCHGIPFAVDAAQSAGILPINMQEENINFLCLPGHKGLYGPMGSGAMLCRGDFLLETLTEGGSGNVSLQRSQPLDLPERFESGTLSVPAICGLNGGVMWLKRHGDGLAERECILMRRLYDCLAVIRGVRIYTPYPSLVSAVPMLTCNIDSLQSEMVAEELDRRGIAVRAGFHCAPTAHRKIGTLQSGAVRICPSAFTTKDDVEKVAKIFTEIIRNP